MKSLSIVCAVILWIVLNGGDAFSQSWTTYTTAQGLPDNKVNCIAFDHTSVLWASTPAGLARYDGTTTKVYTDEDGFPFTAVNTLRAAPNNDIWVSASRQLYSRGAAEYDGNQWKIHRSAQGYSNIELLQLLEGKDGSIWGAGNGLYRYDGSYWVRITDKYRTRLQVAPNGDVWVQYYDLVSWYHDGVWKDFLPFGNVVWSSTMSHSIAVAPDSSVWASVQSDLARFDGNKWEKARCLDPEYYPPHGNISQLTLDSRGGIWAATRDGVGWNNGGKWTSRRGLADNRTTSVAVSPNGNIWVGTLSGVSRFDGVSWTTFRDEALPDRMINDVAAARNGDMWFATPSGATRFDGNSWKTFRKADGLVNDDIRSITIGPDNAVWFATGGGVSRFDGSGWKSYTTANGLVDNRTRKIAFGPEGDWWVATQAGVSRFSGSDWKAYTTTNGLAGNDVRSIFFDAKGIIWFATSGGVSRTDGQNWTSFSVEDGLPASDARSIIQNTDGSLWVATSNGIGIYDGKKWTALIPPPLLSEIGIIYKIAFTADGTLWLGTSHGLWKSLNGKWTQYTPSQGLPEWNISVISVDDQDRLWLGTTKGLCRLDRNGPTVWNTANGLIDNTVGSIAFGPDSSVWISTPKGIAHSVGNSWVTVATKEQLGFSANCVMVGRNGIVWAGLANDAQAPYYEGGVARFDGERWSSWSKESGLSTSDISSLAINSKGEVWAGTSTLGIHLFQESWWSWYNYGNGLPSNNVRYLAFDLSDSLWMSANEGLFQYSEGSWNKSAFSLWGGPSRLQFGSDEAMWAVSLGVARHTSAQSNYWSHNEGLDDIKDILIDANGMVWASGVFIYRFNGRTWEARTGAKKFSSLAQGPMGGIFAGTEDRGVMRVDELPFGVSGENAPEEFAITGNAPNPFNPTTTISFTLPQSGIMELAIYSITGQKIRTLLTGSMVSGKHTAQWDGRDDSGCAVSSGLYIAHLRAGKTAASHRMVLVK